MLPHVVPDFTGRERLYLHVLITVASLPLYTRIANLMIFEEYIRSSCPQPEGFSKGNPTDIDSSKFQELHYNESHTRAQLHVLW